MPPWDDFAEAVLDVVEHIPSGSVMTYGDVADAVGSTNARGVGRVMAHRGAGLPWWRVVPASGLPPAGHHDAALEHYLHEGTVLKKLRDGSYRINLNQARL